MTKVFLLLGEIKPKTRSKFKLLAHFNAFISIIGFDLLATFLFNSLGLRLDSLPDH